MAAPSIVQTVPEAENIKKKEKKKKNIKVPPDLETNLQVSIAPGSDSMPFATNSHTSHTQKHLHSPPYHRLPSGAPPNPALISQSRPQVSNSFHQNSYAAAFYLKHPKQIHQSDSDPRRLHQVPLG